MNYEDGVRRALAFVTSACSSYSGCRQYRENIARAQEAAGPGAPVVDKLRVFPTQLRFLYDFRVFRHTPRCCKLLKSQSGDDSHRWKPQVRIL